MLNAITLLFNELSENVFANNVYLLATYMYQKKFIFFSNFISKEIADLTSHAPETSKVTRGRLSLFEI